MGTWTEDQEKVLTAFCPDDQCRASLFFDESSETVECLLCGQFHEKHTLKDVRKVSDLSEVLKFLRPMLQEKRTEETKVMGISNYVCKLLSPLFTQYGLDRNTQKAKLLSEMGHGNTFNCSRLSSHAFHIDPAHLNIPYYGTDCSGSLTYLSETLSIIKAANDNEERLVPIHTDGDGHCLVYAISRALIGRELFWHALRENLRCHFLEKLEVYKMHFEDFIHPLEWQEIIAECEPNFVPLDGEPLGLRNIHIFGLANVLKRPIILLDSIIGIRSSGDYSGVFLPAFCDPSECRGKDSKLNKPLCIAWNSQGRNHYIPLVGIQGKSLARLPKTLLQKAWGMPNHLISDYIEFDENACCIVGGDKPLSEKYIQQLVTAMKKVYQEVHSINPCLVADVFRFIFKKSGVVGVKPDTVIQTAKILIQDRHLYRCINCEALCEFHTVKKPLGDLSHSSESARSNQQFPFHDERKDVQPTIICSCQHNVLPRYSIKDTVFPRQPFCSHCKSRHVRLVDSDGTIHFLNADRTMSKSSRSKCGYRHYWNGREYDHLPEIFTIPLKCKQRTVNATVEWFQQESDSSYNSNAFQVAEEILQKHFPGEFLSKLLIQYVADQLLQITADINNRKSLNDGSGSPKRKSTATCGSGTFNGSNPTTASSCSSSSGGSGSGVGSTGSPKRRSATTGEGGVGTGDGTSQSSSVHNQQKFQSGSVQQKNKEKQRSTEVVLPSQDMTADPMDVSKDLWKFSQENPQHFSNGGLFYCQLKQEKDFVNGSHFSIPALPGKVFVYNSADDRLDICLRPYGHFSVEPGVEEKARSTKPHLYFNCEYPKPALSSTNFRRSKKSAPSSEADHSSKLFHCKDSMTSDKKGDLTEGKESNKKPAALPKTSYSKSEHPTYQRLGPGFSVLGAEHSNVTNHSLELLHTLAKNIDPAIFDQLKDSEVEKNQVDDDDDDNDDLSSCGNSEDMDI
ncbi:deubiquitinating protein VCIP135 [Octopus sinensis]|uniref:Deubiquitinating protein VCIP135 n=1 Tax=Octopus sinensis TaxID=2607531 RepID=A0A6P7TQ85_9MOLL|nr:deubiquitinating protein VCIP135 [Octopus sinensis]XP_036369265.1 deubiquitinating protein VCIP135 [Octopus sinensis]